VSLGRNKTIDGIIADKPLIAVDFDGTITILTREQYPDTSEGRLLEAAVDVLHHLQSLGYELYILTARPDQGPIKEFLNRFPSLDKLISFVTNVKQEGTLLTIDDRGYRFGGDWLETVDDVIDILNYHTKCKDELEAK